MAGLSRTGPSALTAEHLVTHRGRQRRDGGSAMSASPDAARTILEAAARASLRAPSVFNTQPWKWRISGAAMILEVDPERRLPATDPDSRLLLISCGTALHHARVALTAAGWDAEVRLLP